MNPVVAALFEFQDSGLWKFIVAVLSFGFGMIGLVKLARSTLDLNSTFWKRLELMVGAFILGFMSWAALGAFLIVLFLPALNSFNGTWVVVVVLATALMSAAAVYLWFWPLLVRKAIR